MNDPKPEDWMDYLYEEASPEDKARFQKRLENDAEARRQVETWKATQDALDEWRVPVRASSRGRTYGRIGWAIAALLVLGLGIGIGMRLSPSRSDMASVRKAIQEDVAKEMRAALSEDLTALRVELSDQFAEQLRTEIATASTNILEASDARTQQTVEQLLAVWNEGRQRDLRVMTDFLRQMNETQQAGYSRLRQDLETVALVANDRLNLTAESLEQIAALSVSSARDAVSETNSLQR